MPSLTKQLPDTCICDIKVISVNTDVVYYIYQSLPQGRQVISLIPYGILPDPQVCLLRKVSFMPVSPQRNISAVTLEQTNYKQIRVNWHEAASCALQIELRDYSDLLEYMEEYVLGKNSYRIDLLIIKKLTDKIIPKNIALIFQTFNLFEIKGVGFTTSIDSYYKTIGYAGLLIDQRGKRDQYSCMDVSLTLLSCRYPRKLMKHLRDERKLTVEKISPGVYHVNKETFNIQIIVTKELPPEENLYLRCLTDKLHGEGLAEQLADDYKKHRTQEVYSRYMHQVAAANRKSKEEKHMVVDEWLFEMCGTSSDEVIARAKKESEEYYQPQIDTLSSVNKQLLSENDYLKQLLMQNNIPFKTQNPF